MAPESDGDMAARRRVAHTPTVPLLVVAGERDLLCPPEPAAELAGRAPEGELSTFACGHFDLYDGASIAVEAEFLSRAVAVR
jgi:pimeloyl-ACP methyl ester carboxylesterase